MECDKLKDLMILNAGYELSETELQLLNEHLRFCSICSMEIEKNENLLRFIDKLKNTAIKSENRDESIRYILDHTGSQKLHSGNEIGKSLFLPAFQKFINLAALFLLGLFLLQQIQIQRDLSKLQEQVKENSSSAITYENIEHNLQQYQDFNINSTDLPDDKSEEKIMLLIKSLEKLKNDKTTLEIYLKQNYPEVYKKYLELQNADKSTKINL